MKFSVNIKLYARVARAICMVISAKNLGAQLDTAEGVVNFT